MTSPTLKDVGHIAKFDGKNFPLWKFGCWVILEHHNLLPIVDGTEKKPVEV
jgi:hypothetical protein